MPLWGAPSTQRARKSRMDMDGSRGNNALNYNPHPKVLARGGAKTQAPNNNQWSLQVERKVQVAKSFASNTQKLKRNVERAPVSSTANVT